VSIEPAISMQDRADAALDAYASELETLAAGRPPSLLRDKLKLGGWIYGAGEYGRQLHAALVEDGYPVLGFVDRRGGPGFDRLEGLPVRAPEELTAADAEGHVLVGAVLNPQAGPDCLEPFARSLPFADVLAGADLPDALGNRARTFWQGPRAFLLDHVEDMKRAFGKLADGESLEAAMGLLRYRVTGRADVHPPSDEATMYLPPEFGGFDAPITFVDGGAFIGDTCAYMLAHGVEIDRYVAFEPDETNLKRLTAFAAKARIREASLMPCGLSDALRELSFAGAKGPSSRIAADSPCVAEATTTIRCVALDEMLPGLNPDFIKLDIEGAEMAALAGMRKTLERARPRLAVCLYHRPQDLWEIPALVAEIYGRVHIRQHGPCGWDTVLYALP
jgi:FkbM family methyltransferase